jgi:DNA repair ATPase RecN
MDQYAGSPEAIIAYAEAQERQAASNLAVAQHEHKQAVDYIRENAPKLDQFRKDLESLRIINGWFRGLIEATTMARLREIEQLVNLALNDIFPDRRIAFRFTTETKRDLSTIILHLEANGADGTVRTHGGGILAPISLVFRVLTNMFANHLQLIALDESLVHVSSQYQEPTAQFIRNLCEKLGIVVVLVTHQPTFAMYAHQNISIDQTPSGHTYVKNIQLN